MSKGTVKWFNNKKGYGFIVPESGEKDVFFHVTQLEKIGLHSVSEGQRMNYEIYGQFWNKTYKKNIIIHMILLLI